MAGGSIGAHAFERLWLRVARVLGIGRTTTATNEAGGVATVQVALNVMELPDGCIILQHFGFASALPVGTDVAMLFVGGDRSNGFVVASNHQSFRPRGLTPGQMTIYDNAGSKILLDGAGGISMIPANGALTVHGDVRASGNVFADYGAAGQVDMLGHTHGNVLNGGASTDPPNAGT